VKIFIDTANIDEIKTAASWGILDGVTTNPTLVAREKQPFKELILKICEIVDGPVSAEVISLEADGMVREGRELSKLHPNVVIKIPMTTEGLKAIKILSQEGIRVNTTLIFSPVQALLAAKAGAAFVSPFVGRLDDINHVGMEIVQDIRLIFDNYGFDTEIIVASVRHPLHVREAALLGADIATVPFQTLEKLVKHPLTDIGIERFMRDWEKVKDIAKF